MEIRLTSCTREALDPVQDVQWYKTHEGGRKDMLAKCHNNPGQLAITPIVSMRNRQRGKS